MFINSDRNYSRHLNGYFLIESEGSPCVQKKCYFKIITMSSSCLPNSVYCDSYLKYLGWFFI